MPTRAARSLDAWLDASFQPDVPLPTQPLCDGVSGYQRRLKGLLRPRTATEAVRVIQELRHRAVRFHVVSTGRNWGYGGALPPDHDSVLVSLDQLDQIRWVGVRPVGYAVIEAGVTQGQLAWHLEQEAPDWLLNVTSSSPQTSVLGNTLARGIGCFGPRSADLLSVQLLLPDGRLVWSSTPAPGQPGFPCLTGPDSSGFALQHPNAVALAMAIRLHPRQPVHAMITLRIRHIDYIARVITRVQALAARMDGLGVARIGNRASSHGTWIPQMCQRLCDDHQPDAVRQRAVEQVQIWANRHLNSPWIGVVPVCGSGSQVRHAYAQLKQQLSSCADLRLLTPRRVRFKRRLLALVEGRPAYCAHAAAADTLLDLMGLCAGRPSEFAVRASFGSTGRPTAAGQGLFYFAPCLSVRSAMLREQLQRIDHAYRSAGFEPYLNIHVLPRVGAVAITHARYSMADELTVERALRCLDSLHKLARKHGWALYRSDIDHPPDPETLSAQGLAWQTFDDGPQGSPSAQQQGGDARRA